MANGSRRVANQLGLLGSVQELQKRHPESGLLQEESLQPGASIQQGLLGNMSPADTMAMQTSMIPILGDVTGAAADALTFAQNPESRTPGNFALSAMGMLPFVPSASATKRVADNLMPFNRAETEADAVIDVPVEKLAQAKTGDPDIPLSRSEVRKMAEGSNKVQADAARQMLDRQQALIDQMRQGQAIDPPLVTAADSPSGLGLVDGRNRVILARELGEETIPVRVPRDNLEQVQRAIQGDQ